MLFMQSQRYMPDATQLSVLTAVILLAFALTHALNPAPLLVQIPLGGILIAFNLNLDLAVTILTAILAATGVDWLLRSHPSIEPGETMEHWLLPMMTVLILGITLSTLPSGITWWLGFGLGAALLVLVFLSEYVVVDPADIRYPLASAALTALSFALFFILAVALHAGGMRLFLLAPALFLGGSVISLRSLHLHLNERWEFAWAAGIGLVGMQLGAALHYWPLTPVRFGLLLLGPLYALSILAVRLIEGSPFRRAVIEPAVMLALLWGLAIVFY
jgi:hypothetical protein